MAAISKGTAESEYYHACLRELRGTNSHNPLFFANTGGEKWVIWRSTKEGADTIYAQTEGAWLDCSAERMHISDSSISQKALAVFRRALPQVKDLATDGSKEQAGQLVAKLTQLLGQPKRHTPQLLCTSEGQSIGFFRDSSPTISNLIQALRQFAETGMLNGKIDAVQPNGHGGSKLPDSVRKIFLLALQKNECLTKTIASMKGSECSDMMAIADVLEEIVAFLKTMPALS